MSDFTRNDLKDWFRTMNASAAEENEDSGGLLKESPAWYQMEEPTRPGDIANKRRGPGAGLTGSAFRPGHMSHDQWSNYRMQHIAELTELISNFPDMADTETAERQYWEDVLREALKNAALGA